MQVAEILKPFKFLKAMLVLHLHHENKDILKMRNIYKLHSKCMTVLKLTQYWTSRA